MVVVVYVSIVNIGFNFIEYYSFLEVVVVIDNLLFFDEIFLILDNVLCFVSD